ncbi:MAG: hypothetical protein Q7J70_06420, partial [Thermodesulfovibrionales bacterium]|nr:hypothetical protein [Thermodesulfovibrionales bacterium]
MRKIFLKHFNEKGSGIVETMLVLIVISILVVVVMDRYETIVEKAKKVALKAELNNIRQAILVFKIKNGRFPESLKELVTASFIPLICLLPVTLLLAEPGPSKKF